MNKSCKVCQKAHEHNYLFCQSCGIPMNSRQGKFSNLQVEIPRHFYQANVDGYTQRELMAENDKKHFADQGGKNVMGH
jgi:predicted amidophosphoribosyltransferase